ncbi:MAG TPA: c-type cytochrome [Acidimicrobiales bacterium]|nr:c-type cytochrome [Acidimicrobiales bacterium]
MNKPSPGPRKLLVSPRRRALLAGPLALVGVATIFFGITAWAGPAPSKAVSPAAAATQPVSTEPLVIQAGEQLYDAHCSSCHGIGGVGSKGPELLDVGAAAVDFFLSSGRMPLASPNLEPQSHNPYFNKAQIAEIVAYVSALDVQHGTPGPGIPVTTPACTTETANCPTLSEGNELYMMNCAQCHDASGSGGLLSHGYIVPSLRSATETEIAEAIRVGPRPMPTFGPGQLSDQQVSAIADYLHDITSQPDPGGLGIAHFGPVPEGFVGIIFGLGILLVIIRLIGNRG